MWILAAALLLMISGHAAAETTTLLLPGKAELSFDVSKMTKLKETASGVRYQYLASSLGGDERVNLSVYVEPIECALGKSLKQVSRCFIERLDSVPGVVKESGTPNCTRRRCDIFYVTTVKAGEQVVRQLHLNSLFVYRGGWVDVHLSALRPGSDDSRTFAKFAASLRFVEK